MIAYVLAGRILLRTICSSLALAAMSSTVACGSPSAPASGAPNCAQTQSCTYTSQGPACRQTCSFTDAGDCPNGEVCTANNGCCSGTGCSAAASPPVCCPVSGC